MNGGPLSILLLGDDGSSHAPNVLEHIRALRRLSRHRVDFFNPVGLGHSRLLRLERYDVVVVHYSIFVLEERHLGSRFREQLARFAGLKVQFIQDEYRRVDAMTTRIRELGIDAVFSSVPPHAVPAVYGSRLPGVEILSTLTGYVPAALEGHLPQPLAGRPLDVVYRGRSIPFWLGRLGQDKAAIGREFLARAASTDLRCDISWTEAERIYGDSWYRFLGSSRTTLGTESGASIVDFDGSLQRKTESYLRTRPSATFDEVEREILAPFEGNAVIEAVSPRVFEAAALRTAMVNFVGRYSDVIEPWSHYVPLEKDFSNFDDVLAAIEDDAVLEGIAARAHADLVASGRYSLETFVREFEREIEARARPVQVRPRPRGVAALNRQLLALEQLRSRDRRAELPLVSSLRARALGRVERRLLRRFPKIDALARRRLEPDQREKIHHDLVRLAAAAAAHLRALRYLGPPFDVQPELDDGDRRLTLVGTRGRPQNTSELELLRERVATAIREGRMQEIVWNNSDVGGLTFASVPFSSLEIGYHVTRVSHRFTALLELSRTEPDAVISALEPLFLPRPEAPVDELDQRTATLIRVLLLSPGQSAAQGTAALRTVLASSDLRRLLGAYLGSREAREETSIELLLKDLFRLRLVEEVQADLELDTAGKTLVYRTNAGQAQNGPVLDAATVGSLERIVWDHSSVGSSVVSSARPRVAVTLEGGVYEFQALTPVARRFPEIAAPALAKAATAR